MFIAALVLLRLVLKQIIFESLRRAMNKYGMKYRTSFEKLEHGKYQAVNPYLFTSDFDPF